MRAHLRLNEWRMKHDKKKPIPIPIKIHMGYHFIRHGVNRWVILNYIRFQCSVFRFFPILSF